MCMLLLKWNNQDLNQHLNEKGGRFSLKWASFTKHGKALTASSFQLLPTTDELHFAHHHTRAADTSMVAEV